MCSISRVTSWSPTRTARCAPRPAPTTVAAGARCSPAASPGRTATSDWSATARPTCATPRGSRPAATCTATTTRTRSSSMPRPSTTTVTATWQWRPDNPSGARPTATGRRSRCARSSCGSTPRPGSPRPSTRCAWCATRFRRGPTTRCSTTAPTTAGSPAARGCGTTKPASPATRSRCWRTSGSSSASSCGATRRWTTAAPGRARWARRAGSPASAWTCS